MVVVGTSSRTPAGATPQISVASSGGPSSAAPQSAQLRVVPAGQAAPALILDAAGTTAGVNPGAQSVARYQVFNRGSAPIAPGSLTVSGMLPRGLAKGWTVADRGWSCQSSGDPSTPDCRLRAGVAIGAQAPELTVAYRIRAGARGNQSWTVVARASSAHDTAGPATAQLPLAADVQRPRTASPKSLLGAAAPGPALTVGAKPADTFRRGGSAPLAITILNSGNQRIRSNLHVRIALPSGLKATGTRASGWSCQTSRGRTVVCRRLRAASLALNAAMAPISVALRIARGARSGEPITVRATAGAARGSTTIRPAILAPFAIQASAVPSVISDAASGPVASSPLIKASTGGVGAQQGILSATPRTPTSPGSSTAGTRIARASPICARSADAVG